MQHGNIRIGNNFKRFKYLKKHIYRDAGKIVIGNVKNYQSKHIRLEQMVLIDENDVSNVIFETDLDISQTV